MALMHETAAARPPFLLAHSGRAGVQQDR